MTEAQPHQWVRTTIDKLAANEEGSIAIGPFGSSLKADLYTEFGVPVVRGLNLRGGPGFVGSFVYVDEVTADRFARCQVVPGDLVFPHRGAIGEVGLAIDEQPGKWLLSTSLMKLRPDLEKADSRFLFYFFRSPAGRHQLLRNASQVGTPGIGQPLTSLRACEIDIPPDVSDQRAIADLLGSLDDKIEQNRQIRLTLERLAQAVFRAWFVDFEMVQAKAAGARSFPSITQDAFNLLPDAFVNSSLGPLPEGWHVSDLDQVLDVNPAYRLPKGTFAPYLDMGQIPTEGHSPDTWVMREVGSGAKFTNGDTLVARITPCLENGKTAYVDFLVPGEIGWGSTEYIVLRPKAPIPEVYAYLLARSPEFRAFAIQSMSGTSGRQRVPFTAVSNYQIAVPPGEVFVAFADVVNPIFQRSSAAMRESRTLTTIRDAVLPKLVTGALRLKSEEVR